MQSNLHVGLTLQTYSHSLLKTRLLGVISACASLATAGCQAAISSYQRHCTLACRRALRAIFRSDMLSLHARTYDAAWLSTCCKGGGNSWCGACHHAAPCHHPESSTGAPSSPSIGDNVGLAHHVGELFSCLDMLELFCVSQHSLFLATWTFAGLFCLPKIMIHFAISFVSRITSFHVSTSVGSLRLSRLHCSQEPNSSVMKRSVNGPHVNGVCLVNVAFSFVQYDFQRTSIL